MTFVARILFVAAALATCAPASAQPRVVPPTVRAPVAPETVWLDAPLTPGSWTYRRGPGTQSRALFGRPNAPILQVACGPGRVVTIVRAGGGPTSLGIRTTSVARTLTGRPTPDGLTVQLPAHDRLFDELAFSRGRFSVTSAGAAPLIISAWPELARVVEDCRR
jgi:hypothetical protein